ncbi:hypothetical protein EDEG_00723 [Edhazardia aedis USNM 41457]|uniref:Uncharacterized protein n=1 Tax=Edhazardia aedis (strain USNM 41457) TaxID=1003232 RepID=J9DBT9_EDHAE|nr:hypothetical protein EDEG_00723 [Edhazardia aedis USNM 41457]|eukprot:EJW05191.1 hypothetical protein EDEG_00723 [Edhazardia aedis USNM 41457]
MVNQDNIKKIQNDDIIKNTPINDIEKNEYNTQNNNLKDNSKPTHPINNDKTTSDSQKITVASPKKFESECSTSKMGKNKKRKERKKLRKYNQSILNAVKLDSKAKNENEQTVIEKKYAKFEEFTQENIGGESILDLEVLNSNRCKDDRNDILSNMKEPEKKIETNNNNIELNVIKDIKKYLENPESIKNNFKRNYCENSKSSKNINRDETKKTHKKIQKILLILEMKPNIIFQKILMKITTNMYRSPLKFVLISEK